MLTFDLPSELYGDQAKYFEMETTPRIKHKKNGAISMVNNGSDYHGSQVRDHVMINVKNNSGMFVSLCVKIGINQSIASYLHSYGR